MELTKKFMCGVLLLLRVDALSERHAPHCCRQAHGRRAPRRRIFLMIVLEVAEEAIHAYVHMLCTP